MYAARLDDLAPVAQAADVELTPVDDSTFATWESVWLHEGADAVVSRFIRAAYATGSESATPGRESARNIERAGFACLYTSVGLVRPP